MSEILFTIHDFNIRRDALYQVIPKLDSEAPEGFKEHKTSKIINPDIANSVPGAIFDRTKGIWDTGFYVESSALTRAIPNITERTKLVKDLEKYIVKPIETLQGKDSLSPRPDNNKYWDEFQVYVAKDKIFNTAKPEELLQLYLILLHKQVIPSHLESHPEYKTSSAQYCIVDKDDAIDRRLQFEMETMEANGIFYDLMKNKKSDLVMLLDYVGLPVSGENPDNTVLTSMFNRYLKDKTDGYQNSKVFINAYKKFSTEDGENEVYFHSKLRKLFVKGKVKQRKNEIWFDDQYLGNSFKLAAAKVMEDKELQKQLLELE